MDFGNIKDLEQREALNAIRKVAEKKLDPMRKDLEKKAKKKVINTAKDIGIGKDELEMIAGAAMVADSLGRGEIQGGYDITDNLRLEGKISPRENALRLLYNRGF